ncbi:PAS domain S-box protein [Halogeometricum borinquense]|uniref:histidine kinase n=1 Tax=Halogeometricum borinquense TaxID=60847 RepID=A0A6C0UJV6_9EURY|nr:histidine kinase N-terminal 7TM domain-containing protein [Halogeometricum borinquense]QIB75804.1 PAS domain S-box protein [Halogeometricum borinquense]QIQ75615.1 PAS domain S-box protein [Halogeometricum borinquense]
MVVVTNVYPALLLVAVAISVTLCVMTWRRSVTGSVAFSLNMLAVTLWLVGHTAEVMATSEALIRYWANVQWVAAIVVAPTWFLFVMAYLGKDQWIEPKRLAVLAVEPVVMLLLLVTNNQFHLLWDEPHIDTVTLGWLFGETVTLAAAEPAVGTLAHVAFSYTLLFVGSLYLVRLALASASVYRWQSAAVLLGVSVPWVASAAALSDATSIDLTPVAFSVTGVALSFGLIRYRLLDLVPVARDAVVENLNDSVIVFDRHGRIVDVNDAALAFTDLDEPDVIGASAAEVFTEYTDLIERYQGVEDMREEIEIEHEGVERHYEVDLTPITGRDGSRVGTLTVCRDITERRRRERELERKNNQLERFASVVSHDLRNPLQVATGNVELARETRSDDRLDRVEDALARMDQIIDDMLELTRVDGDSIETSAVNIDSVSNAAWRNVATGDAALTVEAETVVEADRDRLVQLLENLFRNAVEHGSSGETSEPAVEADGGGSLRVWVGTTENGFFVADNGPGIPVTERDTVFEAGHTTGSDGTGLGLSIVSQIANVHGWDVSVGESRAGGARFELTER